MVRGNAVTVYEQNLSHPFRNAAAAVRRDIQGIPQETRRRRSVCDVISCAIIHPIPVTEEKDTGQYPIGHRPSRAY